MEHEDDSDPDHIWIPKNNIDETGNKRGELKCVFRPHHCRDRLDKLKESYFSEI